MTMSKPIDEAGREQPQVSIIITWKSSGTVFWRVNKKESQQQKKADNWVLFLEHLHFPLIAELRVPGTS